MSICIQQFIEVSFWLIPILCLLLALFPLYFAVITRFSIQSFLIICPKYFSCSFLMVYIIFLFFTKRLQNFLIKFVSDFFEWAKMLCLQEFVLYVNEVLFILNI